MSHSDVSFDLPEFEPGHPLHGSKSQRYWLLRHHDLIAFELIFRARRVMSHGRVWHEFAGRRYPVHFPNGLSVHNRWNWTFGTTCPQFHQDSNATTEIENIIAADKLQDIYLKELMDSASVALPDLTHADLFRLVVAPPAVRLIAANAAYLKAIREGLIPPRAIHL